MAIELTGRRGVVDVAASLLATDKTWGASDGAGGSALCDFGSI
jgi:hypothetical protein